jgi:hypothetical protein
MKSYTELYTLVENALQRDHELEDEVCAALRYLNISPVPPAAAPPGEPPVQPTATPLGGPITLPLPDGPRDEANAIFASWHKSNNRGIGFLPEYNHDPMLVFPNRQIVPAPKFHVLNDEAKLLIKDSIDEYVAYIDSLFPNEKLYAKIGSCYQRRLWTRIKKVTGTYPKELYAHEFSMVIHALFTTNAAGEAAETYGLKYLYYDKGRGLNQRGLLEPESFSRQIKWNNGANRGVIYITLSRFSNSDSYYKAYQNYHDIDRAIYKVNLDEFTDFIQRRQYKTSKAFYAASRHRPEYIPSLPPAYYRGGDRGEWKDWNDYLYQPRHVSPLNPRVETFDWCRLVGEPHVELLAR